ncbi:MAG: VWA domain-containing protein [Cyanobacteria bacterium J06649_11]
MQNLVVVAAILIASATVVIRVFKPDYTLDKSVMYLLGGAATVAVIDRFQRIEVAGAKFEFKDVEKLEKETNQLKEQVKIENPNLETQIDKRAQDLIDRAFEVGSSPFEALTEITAELRRTLKMLANKAGVEENTISESVLVRGLTDGRIIAKSVATVLIEFLSLVKKITLRHSDLSERQIYQLQRLTEIGIDIINLLDYESLILRAPKEPVQPVEISSAGIQVEVQPEQRKIIFYLTVIVVDEDRNIFPAEILNKNNFQITEEVLGKKAAVNILSVEPLAQTKTPLRAILAVDSSGSMGNEKSKTTLGELKIDKVKGASRFLIKKLLDYSKQGIDVGIAILSFNGNKVSASDFVSNNPNGIYSKKDKELNTAINKIKVESNRKTPLWDAVNLALDNSIQERGYKVIICLTDGISNSGSMNLEDVIEKVRLSNIPVFTIGYGYKKEIDLAGLVRLSKVSKAGEQGVGSFINVSSSEISKVFDDIGHTLISTYKICCKANNLFSGQTTQYNIRIKYDDFSKNEVVYYTAPQTT